MAEESSSRSSLVSDMNSHSLQIRMGRATLDRGPRRGLFSLADVEDDVQFDSKPFKIDCYKPCMPLLHF